MERGHVGEMVGGVERVQGRVDRGRQERVGQTAAAGHEVKSL